MWSSVMDYKGFLWSESNLEESKVKQQVELNALSLLSSDTDVYLIACSPKL